MCWSATTSILTLCIGTLLNIGSYLLLRSWNSPTALLVWSWQYALLMQIPEAIVWIQLDYGGDVSMASRVAMVLNITQPLALLVGIRFSGLYREFRYAYAVMLLYGVAILSQMDVIWPLSESIAPEEGCAHLDLRYWNTSRGLVYVTTSLLVVSEARPVFWALVNACIFTITLLLAIVVYPCGVGSVWCWFIFVSGPILVVADRTRDRTLAWVERRRHSVTPERTPPVQIQWRKPRI